MAHGEGGSDQLVVRCPCIARRSSTRSTTRTESAVSGRGHVRAAGAVAKHRDAWRSTSFPAMAWPSPVRPCILQAAHGGWRHRDRGSGGPFPACRTNRVPRRPRSGPRRSVGMGANTALRAPSTMSASPAAASDHCWCRWASVSPECRTATRLPGNRPMRRPPVWGVSAISGTRNRAIPCSSSTCWMSRM